MWRYPGLRTTVRPCWLRWFRVGDVPRSDWQINEHLSNLSATLPWFVAFSFAYIFMLFFYTPYIDDTFLTIMKLCIIGLLLWQQRRQKKMQWFSRFLLHSSPAASTCLSTGAGSQQCQKLRMDQLSDYWKQGFWGTPMDSPWAYGHLERVHKLQCDEMSQVGKPKLRSHPHTKFSCRLFSWQVHIFTCERWAYYRALSFF